MLLIYVKNYIQEFNDPTIAKIEKAIAVHFYSEMLSKCLQLLENGWVKESGESVLALLLMADWLVQCDDTDENCALPLKCYTLLQDKESVEKLEALVAGNKSGGSGENHARTGDKTKNNDKHKEISETVTDENDRNIDNNIQAKTENSDDENSTTDKQTNDPSGTTTSMKVREWEALREKCPFCEADASLQSLKSLQCVNGHTYSRCCLTLRTTTMNGRYRRCVGCGRTASRKCFQSELNIDSVLLNIDLCPFCGCRFIEHNS